MAGQEIYLGKMIEGLQTDINTMRSDMNTMVTELQTVASLTSMGIAQVNVIPSDNKKIYTNESTEILCDYTVVTLGNYNCFANGMIKFKGTIRHDPSVGAGQNVTMTLSVNGTAKATISASALNETKSGTSNISVVKGDVIKIEMASNSFFGMKAYAPAGETYIGYEYLSISQNGPIVLV